MVCTINHHFLKDRCGEGVRFWPKRNRACTSERGRYLPSPADTPDCPFFARDQSRTFLLQPSLFRICATSVVPAWSLDLLELGPASHLQGFRQPQTSGKPAPLQDLGIPSHPLARTHDTCHAIYTTILLPCTLDTCHAICTTNSYKRT